MASFLYNTFSSHSRTDSGKTTSPKTDLFISTSHEFININAGLQGCGKYTDNAFRSSLRSDLPSPSSFRQTQQHKQLTRTSNIMSVTLPSECMSARTPKAIFSGANSLKHSARAEIGNAALNELKAKENHIPKQKSTMRHQAPAKPKLRSQGRVLREINREWTNSRSKNSGYTCTGYTPYCSSLPTENDSFVSEMTNIVPVDINQQLRDIFKVGVKEVNEENDTSVTIPEEQIEVEYLKAKNKNKPYVSRQKQLKSSNKF